MKKWLWVIFIVLCKNTLAQDSYYSNTRDSNYKYPYYSPPQSNITITNQTAPTYQPRSPLIDYQEAYSLYLDNKIKKVETFWHLHDIYKERQKEKFEEIQQKRKFYLANHGLQPFTSEEFDSSVGTINWPNTLRQDQYIKYRLIFDDLMNSRAYSGLSMEEYYILKKASKEWRNLLASQKEYYPKEVLSEMIRFILKIDMELRA